MKATLLRAVFLLFAGLVVAVSLPAQNNPSDAHLSGRLTDLSGYGIGGVKITAQVENGPNARVWSAISPADGAYLLIVPPGHSSVHFQHASFAARDVVLDLAPAENHSLDLRLEIERLSDNVVVTANAQPLELDRTPAPVDVVGRQEIDQRQAVSLPDLLSTQTGISLARTGPIGGLCRIFFDCGHSSFTKHPIRRP